MQYLNFIKYAVKAATNYVQMVGHVFERQRKYDEL